MIDNGLPPIHPGEFLAEILEELEISQAQFACDRRLTDAGLTHYQPFTTGDRRVGSALWASVWSISPILAQFASCIRPETSRGRHGRSTFSRHGIGAGMTSAMTVAVAQFFGTISAQKARTRARHTECFDSGVNRKVDDVPKASEFRRPTTHPADRAFYNASLYTTIGG